MNGISPRLAPKSRRIFLEGYSLPVDIGFHDFEIGTAQPLSVTIEAWVDEAHFAPSDDVADAWNYDLLRREIDRLAHDRRYNLQETFVRALYAFVAARPGVTALRVATSKPNVYPNCRGVGVELASFETLTSPSL